MFSGFTKLCKGLAVILIGGHVVVQLLPTSVTYLALIPARFSFFIYIFSHQFYVNLILFGVRIFGSWFNICIGCSLRLGSSFNQKVDVLTNSLDCFKILLFGCLDLRLWIVLSFSWNWHVAFWWFFFLPS